MRKMTLGTKTFPREIHPQELFVHVEGPTHAITEADLWMTRLKKKEVPHHLTRMRETLQSPLHLQVEGAIVE